VVLKRINALQRQRNAYYQVAKAKLMKPSLCTKASWLVFQAKIMNNNPTWIEWQLIVAHAHHGEKKPYWEAMDINLSLQNL